MIVLTILALVAALYFAYRFQWERRYRKELTLTGKWPIPAVALEEVDEMFRPGPFGPGLQTEVALVGKGPVPVAGGTADAEAWILAALAKRARILFEFGTCTGKTAYLWARNAPEDAVVVTLTLAASGASEYRHEGEDAERDRRAALKESQFVEFLYSGTAAASKIVQLYGDSKTVDLAAWQGRCDLVFVDGSHAYSYVMSDSARALQLARPGGLVLWHDYAGPRHSPGVYRALNELRAHYPLVRIATTSLVALRTPMSDALAT